MTSRADHPPIDGILVIDKGEGPTSSDVVQRVRRLLRIDKVGHTGTLDPMATGVLPLCLGKATALAQLLTGQDKRYQAVLALGARTDSGDAQGKITEEREVPALERLQVEAVLGTLLGPQLQVPPMVSAIQIGGQRLYDLARRGESVERRPRPIDIKALGLIALSPTRIEFEVRCSKGTYVRVLGEEIAARLGTVGHLAALRRTQSGRFDLGSAMTLAQLGAGLSPKVLSMELAVADFPHETLDGAEVRALAYGKKPLRPLPGAEGFVGLLDPEGKLVALALRGSSGEVTLTRVLIQP